MCENYKMINIGMVPINVHNVGIYFKCFLDTGKDYFNLIKNEHTFQTLIESNKPNNAFRKEIYLSRIEKVNDELRYHLLRCSSNLSGPTDNFRETDNEIISQVNNICQDYFSQKVELNHVLAQIYENSNQGKAKIKAHSDKTKDMPRNGLIAFCTFYNFGDLKGIKKSVDDNFDYCYNGTSVLTRLRFRLKPEVNDDNLVKRFCITLYPNSLFVIPLSTNRLYTHEIVPSIMSFDKMPTRLGYVIRCSKTRAVFRNGQTYIHESDGNMVKLRDITDDDRNVLRDLYYIENTTDKIVDYGDVYYSMNKGDYVQPIL